MNLYVRIYHSAVFAQNDGIAHNAHFSVLSMIFCITAIILLTIPVFLSKDKSSNNNNLGLASSGIKKFILIMVFSMCINQTTQTLSFTKIVENAAWSRRYRFGYDVLNGKCFVVGGKDLSVWNNDV